MTTPAIHRRPGIPGPRAAVGEIVPGLYQRSLFTTSAFIVITPDPATGDSHAAIIDAGWRYRHNRPVLNYLRQLGCGPSEVRQLIATHWHPDHIGGMAGLQRATGAAAAAHRIEAAAIAGAPGAAIPHPAPARHRWLRPILWPALTPPRPPAFPVATRAGRRRPATAADGGAGSAHAGAYAGEHQPAIFRRRGRWWWATRYSGSATGLLCLPAGFPVIWRRRKRRCGSWRELDFEVICFSHFQPMRRGARGALRSLAEYLS